MSKKHCGDFRNKGAKDSQNHKNKGCNKWRYAYYITRMHIYIRHHSQTFTPQILVYLQTLSRYRTHNILLSYIRVPLPLPLNIFTLLLSRINSGTHFLAGDLHYSHTYCKTLLAYQQQSQTLYLWLECLIKVF